MNIIKYEQYGYSDEQTLKQVRILEHVMFQTKEVKKGRGRKAIVTHEYVYNTEEDDEVRDKITNTIKHYEAKLENLSKKDNK
tara:strand:- start:12484 stop:12729 length:246 start_codon:yes stop_codon:yes gene_type:complete